MSKETDEGPAPVVDGPRIPEPIVVDGAGEPQAVIPVCRLLRTKTAFGSLQPGAPDWRTGDSTTAVYWCLKTMETAGIDDGYAHPHVCREGRICFAKAIE